MLCSLSLCHKTVCVASVLYNKHDYEHCFNETWWIEVSPAEIEIIKKMIFYKKTQVSYYSFANYELREREREISRKW